MIEVIELNVGQVREQLAIVDVMDRTLLPHFFHEWVGIRVIAPRGPFHGKRIEGLVLKVDEFWQGNRIHWGSFRYRPLGRRNAAF